MGRTVSIFGSLAIAASLAACAAAGGGPQQPSRPDHPSAAAATTPAVGTSGPGGGPMTGAQLKVLLLAEDDLPGGFRLNPKWSADSGKTLYPPMPATRKAPSTRECVQLTSAPWLPAAGVPPVSFAANGYQDVYSNEIDQMVAVYPQVAIGRAVMMNLARLFAFCSSFVSTSHGQRMRMTLSSSAVPAAGGDAIKTVLTSFSMAGWRDTGRGARGPRDRERGLLVGQGRHGRPCGDTGREARRQAPGRTVAGRGVAVVCHQRRR